jgi:hypothetical protein
MGASISDKAKNKQTRDIGLNLFHALGKILYNKRSFADGEQVLSRCVRSLWWCLLFGEGLIAISLSTHIAFEAHWISSKPE